MTARTASYERLGCLVLCLVMVGCGEAGNGAAHKSAAGASHGPLSGRITPAGVSTGLPVSRAMADGFQKAHAAVQVAVESSGTTGGFRKFCAGQLDISGASRPINAAESRQCADHKIEFIELPVAFDSLSVVTNSKNTFASCLTVGELKKMWEP